MKRTSEYRRLQGNIMLTLQRRQLVGHDILLARHGNHISTMRVDRANDRVIAFLDDGSTDSAPNLITPGPEPAGDRPERPCAMTGSSSPVVSGLPDSAFLGLDDRGGWVGLSGMSPTLHWHSCSS